MRLLHLTAVGPQVLRASLEFAPRLTVVYGASETGKTYVIDALNFMLGAKALREIPEAAGYQLMLLGIEFDDGEIVTLARDLRGGRVQVFYEDLRDLPERPADHSLLGQHHKDNHDNVSHFLLDRLGIADAKLRKNNRNVLQAMSFRNLAHLVLVDEERMQSRNSPVETGNPTSRTAERSAFKLLLEGEDDSGLGEGDDPDAFRRINQGQVNVLDRAIGQVRARLDGAPDRPECLDLVTRVNTAIRDLSGSMADNLVRRDSLIQQRNRQHDERRQSQVRASEGRALFNRFSLLDAQYASDLDRLQLVKETGTLLGYFDTEACVFCGAHAEHQRREHAIYETVQLADSVDAEAAKTEALKGDLAQTLLAVQNELDQALERIAILEADLRTTSTQIREVEDLLQPSQASLDELIARRSEVERWIDLWARISELEELRATVAQETPTPADPITHGVTITTQRAFSNTLRRILADWEVPGVADATLTFTTTGAPEIVVQQRAREGRGKGMRSVLHAGFCIALSEFCIERELPHPGFVALDTPVLTYRDAETIDGDLSPEASQDELLSGSVADAFYRYLANTHGGQTIILENQTPPEVNAADCSIVYFTGNPASGRAGFYPVEGERRPARTT